jgi:cytochrome c553
MKPVLLLAVLASFGVTAYAFDPAASWTEHCAKCHGKDGRGETKTGRKLGIKDYTDPKLQAEFSDQDAIQAIKEGVADNHGKVHMKPIEGLSDDEIKGLVAYFRTLKR